MAEEERTGILPQLLNPATEQDLETLLLNDRFLLQPKLDGKRLLLKKENGVITGINRRGIACGIPESLHKDANALPGDYLISGVSITPLIFTEAHKSASPQTAVRRGEALYGLFDAETGAIWNN